LKLVQLRRLMPFTELVARVEELAGGAPVAPRPAAAPRVVPTPAAPPPPPRPTSTSTSTPAPVPTAAPVAAPPPPAAAPTPAPPPPPEPPPAPKPRADVSSGAGLLAAMIEAGQTRPSLLQPLRMAQAELNADGLTLTVAADFVPLAQMHADEYAQLASKAAGRPVKIRVSAGGATAAAEAAKPSVSETRKQDLMEQATREPAVQEALDLFGARIVDVRVEEGS